MSEKDILIRVGGLSKSYRVGTGPSATTLGEVLWRRVRNPLAGSGRASSETFWALRDVSFNVRAGEVVGIVGRNGAGKSTLLKLLGRVAEPTEGQVDLWGRVGSLLEVGTGFHPELTGRENIYLNGAILGMRRHEIKQRFDEIVAFSGVERFLDTPVKRYSSGMYVRLAFAVAAHLDAEVLVVDEVLAVGDAEFQKKCLGKIRDAALGGRTILFVSHSMQAISTLCTRAIYLDCGQVVYDGEVSRAVQLYMDYAPPKDGQAVRRRGGSGEIRYAHFSTDRNSYQSTDDIICETEIVANDDSQPDYFVSMTVSNQMGLTVLHLDSRLLNTVFDNQQRRHVRWRIVSPRLAQGTYTINAYICHAAGVIDCFEGAATIEVVPILPYPCSRGDCADRALVYPEFSVEEVQEVGSMNSTNLSSSTSSTSPTTARLIELERGIVN